MTDLPDAPSTQRSCVVLDLSSPPHEARLRPIPAKCEALASEAVRASTTAETVFEETFENLTLTGDSRQVARALARQQEIDARQRARRHLDELHSQLGLDLVAQEKQEKPLIVVVPELSNPTWGESARRLGLSSDPDLVIWPYVAPAEPERTQPQKTSDIRIAGGEDHIGTSIVTGPRVLCEMFIDSLCDGNQQEVVEPDRVCFTNIRMIWANWLLSQLRLLQSDCGRLLSGEIREVQDANRVFSSLSKLAQLLSVDSEAERENPALQLDAQLRDTFRLVSGASSAAQLRNSHESARKSERFHRLMGIFGSVTLVPVLLLTASQVFVNTETLSWPPLYLAAVVAGVSIVVAVLIAEVQRRSR